MILADELRTVADAISELDSDSVLSDTSGELEQIETACEEMNAAFSGSWLGYHAWVYHEGFTAPPPGAHFSKEWGLMDIMINDTTGNWVEYSSSDIENRLLGDDGRALIKKCKDIWAPLSAKLSDLISDATSILTAHPRREEDPFIKEIYQTISGLNAPTASDLIKQWQPRGQQISRDSLAVHAGLREPVHLQIMAEARSIRLFFVMRDDISSKLQKVAAHFERLQKQQVGVSQVGTNVFIGHGRSNAWRELKDFVRERLDLPADEFNRVPVAGITNQTRLAQMLDSAALAFIVMTAEDETLEGTSRARMNVIHEVGLFQGRLGFTKAIVLLEDGCEEFSNIQGLGQIRFPKGNIKACFEEVRAVAEREGLI